MTEKEQLARKSLKALFLELPESVATHHLQIVIDALEEAKNISSNPVLAVRAIVEKHTEKLNTMKANRAKWEEEKWTDAEIYECDRLIAQLAEILSELNRSLA